MITTIKITRLDNARGGRHYQVEGFAETFPSVITVLGVSAILWERQSGFLHNPFIAEYGKHQMEFD